MLFTFLAKKLRLLGHMARAGDAANRGNAGGGAGRDQPSEPPLAASLDENLRAIQRMLGDSTDMKVHRMALGPDGGGDVAIAFIDGMVSSMLLTEAVLQPLAGMRRGEALPRGKALLNMVRDRVLCIGEIERVGRLDEVLSGMLAGDTALLIDGCDAALVLGTKGYEKRSVTEPQTESVIRGPREGFTENVRTNTALMRRRIQNPELRLETLVVGRKTRTRVCLMYIDGVANPRVLETVRRRIDDLDVDSVLESGYIEQYIEDAPFSPFATIGYTEKPDVVAAQVLEGRVAILVDGTPFALTAPMLFYESFQSAEDYYVRPIYATMGRLLRFFGYFITVFGPAVFIALTTFHQELIPTTLLFSIASAREGTPFPTFVEALFLLLTYEVLREGGLRL
ncbi:MAG: spore germination protein, partial [Clostridiales bacterium]|nr:spore germination protein [Clostridiales bacterium]